MQGMRDGLAHPSHVYPEADPLFYGDYNDCIKLYPSNNVEDDCIGLVFDMDTNNATWVDQPLDTPPEYTEHVWLPLDEIPEAWLYYIRRKRCIPRGHESMAPTRGDMTGWDMVYPAAQDVDDTVATWNEYVSLVESKLSVPGRRLQADAESNPDAGLCTTCDADRQDGVGLVLPSSEGYDFWSTGPVSRTANCPPRLEKVWQPVPNEPPMGPSILPDLPLFFRSGSISSGRVLGRLGLMAVQGTLDGYVRLEEYVGYEVEFRPVGMLLDAVDK